MIDRGFASQLKSRCHDQRASLTASESSQPHCFHWEVPRFGSAKMRRMRILAPKSAPNAHFSASKNAHYAQTKMRQNALMRQKMRILTHLCAHLRQKMRILTHQHALKCALWRIPAQTACGKSSAFQRVFSESAHFSAKKMR